MERQQNFRPTLASATLVTFIALSLLMNILDTHAQVGARNFKSTSYLPISTLVSRDEIIARAKAWVNGPVLYDESSSYQGYREDCSGYVSMTWQLSGSLTTYTLPTVSHQINKDDLLPGDILLNQWGGWSVGTYGSPDAHVVLFDSWVDSSHTRYNAYEESPYYGEAHYTTNIPYPYWPGYDSADYVPMRFNSLSNSSVSVTVPIPTPSSGVHVGEAWTGMYTPPCQGTTCFGNTREITLTIQSIQPEGERGSPFTGLISDHYGNKISVNGTVGSRLSEFSSDEQSLLQEVMTSIGISTSQMYIVFSDSYGSLYVGVRDQNGDWRGMTKAHGLFGGSFDLKKSS